jgi:protein TonB
MRRIRFVEVEFHPTPAAMTPHKKQSADLRRRYPMLFEIGLALSLGLLVLLFTIPLESESSLEIVESKQEVVLVEEVEQTRQVDRPPPPPRAPAPIEVANEQVTEEIELDFDMDLDLSESATAPPAPPPPPAAPEPEPEPQEPEIFVVVEQPPRLIGGIQGVQEQLHYPEIARRAGIEGTVFVQFVVDENGNVVDPFCIRDPGGQTCEEALRVVRDSKFEPGRQRGQAVKVRFSIPVKFRLE